MKKLMCFGAFIFGMTTLTFGQEMKSVDLPEVEVVAMNYKYLNSVSPEKVADISIQTIEERVASYDLADADFYREDHDLYYVTFYIPEGKILAAYDGDGKIIRTAERFKNINLPNHVKEAVADRFPGWEITKDLYFVNYFGESGVTKKTYKIKLKNEDKTIRVKVDDDGNFM